MDAQSLLDTTAQGDDQDRSLSTSLETLSTLHALQSNLQTTKQVLTAAATWDSTISSIAPLLAEKNLTEAVNALSQLEAGERALRGMPHREERHASILEIRQQVHAMLQPQLKHALQNMNTRLAPLQQCVALYTKLDKMDSLQSEYVKQRPGSVHKAWFSYGPTTTTGPSDMDTSNTSSTSNASGGFVAWLPTWYENVLNLLQEERRQSTLVFGPAEAPEIVAKVLREAFRPILPSFRGRLESVFPSNAASHTGAGMMTKASFASIASLYESTLRFLSLAYEIVAGAFLDVIESGAGRSGDTGLNLYQDLRAVFLQIASPFSLYSEHFASLEGKHIQVAASGISKDMQQTVGVVSSSSNLQSLQEATARLKDLAPFIFPLLNGSLDRFELMDGGYDAQGLIGTMDSVLSTHIGELVIAIRSLSASLTGDLNKLAEDFDEQSVLCAMEMLKLAGNFRRDAHLFENGTRDRMKALSQRMEDFLMQEREMDGSASNSKGSSFSFPDSLSIVDLDSFLTNAVCGGNDQANVNESNPILILLQRLGSSAAMPTSIGDDLQALEHERTLSLFPKSNEAFTRLTGSCHSFVFEVCSAVPRKHLTNLSAMAAWKEGSSSASIDSYGTLPQQYITQVGEHMLALVQALEPFAADPENLSLANEVMNHLRDVALPYWSDFLAAAGYLGNDFVVLKLMNGPDIAGLVLNNAALGEEDAQLAEGASAAEIASAAFCNAWLDVVGLAVTGLLLERIVRIPQLTPKGCEHLAADLNYLVNVFSALGVAGHPHPLVSHMASLSTLGDSDLEAQIHTRNRNSEMESALKAVEERLALLRGVPVNP